MLVEGGQEERGKLAEVTERTEDVTAVVLIRLLALDVAAVLRRRQVVQVLEVAAEPDEPPLLDVVERPALPEVPRRRERQLADLETLADLTVDEHLI